MQSRVEEARKIVQRNKKMIVCEFSPSKSANKKNFNGVRKVKISSESKRLNESRRCIILK